MCHTSEADVVLSFLFLDAIFRYSVRTDVHSHTGDTIILRDVCHSRNQYAQTTVTLIAGITLI